ncbi:MAG TPA: sulfite oxidase-like oxidoreductase [Gemmataceae bacterium]
MSDTPPRPEGPDVILSADTRRAERIPPGQVLTRKWPVLHAGEVPPFDPEAWDFYIFPKPLVKEPKRFTYAEFMALPKTKVFADMHCVTRWSKLDNLWEGVATRELLNHVELDPRAKFVMVHCEYGFTTNLPVEDFFGEDCLFAYRHNGQDLEPDHGWPLRLVVPRLYAWKSAKWVRGIEFMEEDRPGFWESWEHGGYHMRGDPWAEERYRPDSEHPTAGGR